MLVFKFGGASVNSVNRIKNVGEILRQYPDQKILVVISAMGKMTNALEKVVEAFYAGKNKEALQLFLTHRPTFMSHLILSHLSANNNKPEIVEELFSGVAGNTEIVIASRKKETQLYHIKNDFSFQRGAKPIPFKQKTQLSLFDAPSVAS